MPTFCREIAASALERIASDGAVFAPSLHFLPGGGSCTRHQASAAQQCVGQQTASYRRCMPSLPVPNLPNAARRPSTLQSANSLLHHMYRTLGVCLKLAIRTQCLGPEHIHSGGRCAHAGPNAEAHEEQETHIQAMHGFVAPEVYGEFVQHMRATGERLDAQAVVAVVPRGAIAFPSVGVGVLVRVGCLAEPSLFWVFGGITAYDGLNLGGCSWACGVLRPSPR